MSVNSGLLRRAPHKQHRSQTLRPPRLFIRRHSCHFRTLKTARPLTPQDASAIANAYKPMSSNWCEIPYYIAAAKIGSARITTTFQSAVNSLQNACCGLIIFVMQPNNNSTPYASNLNLRKTAEQLNSNVSAFSLQQKRIFLKATPSRFTTF